MLFWRDGVFEILKFNWMTEMNSINFHCGMAQECCGVSLVLQCDIDYGQTKNINISSMKRNLPNNMQSSFVNSSGNSKSSIVN